jgi:hypothetical protein
MGGGREGAPLQRGVTTELRQQKHNRFEVLKMSTTIMRIGESGFYITGALSVEELKNLKRDEGIKSFLYLCPDADGDCGLPDGFAAAAEIFSAEESRHTPLAMSDFAFTVRNLSF